LNGKILRNTTSNIFVLVVVCCAILTLSMQSLASSILLDNLQPMARQSAKTVEANIHTLADRMINIASDSRLQPPGLRASRMAVLTEAAEVYELYAVALYNLDGTLMVGTGDAPASLNDSFLDLLQTTDNLTTDSTTIFQGRLGITMGMPVQEDGKTFMYVVGVYKYDALNDVLRGINVGRNGVAFMVSGDGTVTGHPNQTLALQGATLSQIGGGGYDRISHRMTNGETGATEAKINGKAMLLAFSPIRGTQWSLILEMPKSDYNYLINGGIVAAALVTLVVLVISILLVLRLSRSISLPVKNVTGRMVALSEGDLHSDVPPSHSGDEIEVLASTLANTVVNVNLYISDIQRVLSQIAAGNLDIEPNGDYKGDFALIRDSLGNIIQSMNETMDGFRSAAVRLSDMSDQLKDQSGQLYQASMEQNHSAGELVDEVSLVKEQLGRVTQSSQETMDKTDEIVRGIGDADRQMNALLKAMDGISVNTEEITKIAKAIEDISFQTSILAINASIEAARAGAAGRGFSVVAGEVKRLASKSAEAAQSATSMGSNTHAIIQNGVELTAGTAKSLRSIHEVSSHIGGITDDLAAAVREQEEALLVMEQKIGEISAVADRNLQNAGEMEQSSGTLAQEASALQERVRSLTLKGDRAK